MGNSRDRVITTLACLIGFGCAPVLASDTVPYPKPVAGDYTIRDFRFASGETLPEVRLHYLTIGTPNRDASGNIRNAVLFLHGTSGTGRGLLSSNFGGALFGPGQLLDATTHFIILPDSIGYGGSSKPSDGLRMKFPRYTCPDHGLPQRVSHPG